MCNKHLNNCTFVSGGLQQKAGRPLKFSTSVPPSTQHISLFSLWGPFDRNGEEQAGKGQLSHHLLSGK